VGKEESKEVQAIVPNIKA